MRTFNLTSLIHILQLKLILESHVLPLSVQCQLFIMHVPQLTIAQHLDQKVAVQGCQLPILKVYNEFTSN